MKTGILSAIIAMAAFVPAGAQTMPTQVQLSSQHITHIVLIDEKSGRVIASFDAVVSSPSLSWNSAGYFYQPHRAFENIAPLTIQQENDATEQALELTLPPLHTP